MTDQTAISGTRRQYKEMADGTLRVQIDIDPQFKKLFLELFGVIDMPVALAPLKADFENYSGYKPMKGTEEELTGLKTQKGGPLSISAAQLCDNAVFQAFLANMHTDKWAVYRGVHSHTITAAKVVREICNVESRADIDHNDEAKSKFQNLMRQYRDWNIGKE